MSVKSQSVRGTGWAMIGLLLVVAGPILYWLLLDLPLMRATGAPAFALISAGAAASIVAALRDRRAWVRTICCLDVLALPVALYLFFGLAVLPDATAIAQMDIAPEFTLPDHTGEEVVLYDLLAEGPVMLVFYRGHW
ncbi:MAG: hypothetical protein ACYTFA_08855 [Planctomycetota bacterium]